MNPSVVGSKTALPLAVLAIVMATEKMNIVKANTATRTLISIGAGIKVRAPLKNNQPTNPAINPHEKPVFEVTQIPILDMSW